MIVECVALLMFVQGEIKEARYQPEGMAKCIRGKLTAERQYSETVSHKCPNTPNTCLLYTSPSPRDRTRSRMPSSA